MRRRFSAAAAAIFDGAGLVLSRGVPGCTSSGDLREANTEIPIAAPTARAAIPV